jgi:outer membrane protein assembly factor BamB
MSRRSMIALRWAIIVTIVFGFMASGTLDLNAQENSLSKAPDWSCWRGPKRDGVIPPTVWPEHLTKDNLKMVWSVSLEPSYSGPVLSDAIVFTTETRSKKTEWVTAFDRKTGEKLWEQSWDGSLSVPFFAKANGDWIRSTPAFDGESLYVAGMRDVLVCLNAADGKVKWKVDFVNDLKRPVPDFGFVCSPLIDGEFVYVQAGAAFFKLEKATGKVVWETLKDNGGMWGSAFSSPTIAEVAGKRQVLVQTRTELCGVDPENGKVLWAKEIPAFRGMNIVTPTIYKDSVFTSAYGSQSFMFSLTSAENQVDAKETWTNRARGYMSSPIVIGDYVYLHLQNQRFTCIDLRDGETKWTSEPFGKYWSMVANGSKILALDERGEILLIDANPEEFKVVDRLKISDDPTWAHIAISGDEVYVRSLKSLMAFKWSN